MSLVEWYARDAESKRKDKSTLMLWLLILAIIVMLAYLLWRLK